MLRLLRYLKKRDYALIVGIIALTILQVYCMMTLMDYIQGITQAITYVSITVKDGKKVWGAGIHDDIIASSIKALFSAINRSIERG